MRTLHRRSAVASREALWERATQVRLDETRSLSRLVRWRIPGTDPAITYHELLVRQEPEGWLAEVIVDI